MKSSDVRKAAVAGMFYPDDPAELRDMVADFLAQADAQGPAPKALIAPHAGYVYSGPIAASAFARLRSARDVVRRVVLMGPSHRVPFHGMAVPTARFFATPLGTIPIDEDAVRNVLALPQVVTLDAAHAMEHSLEVHLPFLQVALDEFSLVPIVVGEADPDDIADVLDAVWGGPETLLVISSDLSHYYDYKTARRMDEATSKSIEALHPDEIQFEQACGRLPIKGLLTAAREHGLRAATVDLRNSGDTAGPRDQVVGYGAYVFT
jgi:AmmeMemoRadiSam system protein B